MNKHIKKAIGFFAGICLMVGILGLFLITGTIDACTEQGMATPTDSLVTIGIVSGIALVMAVIGSNMASEEEE